MQNFCIAYRGILAKNQLFATGTTGRLIEEVANLQIHKYLAGHLGGSQQLGAQIEHNEIDLVIFLRDPLTRRSGRLDWYYFNKLMIAYTCLPELYKDLDRFLGNALNIGEGRRLFKQHRAEIERIKAYNQSIFTEEISVLWDDVSLRS